MKYNIEFSFSVVFDILIVIAEDVIFNLFILFLIFVIGTMNVLVITMLAKFPQGRTVGFATPGVPITPILGIAINFYLMLRLSPLTLIRFTVWMVLGKDNSQIRVVTFCKKYIQSSFLRISQQKDRFHCSWHRFHSSKTDFIEVKTDFIVVFHGSNKIFRCR